MSPPQPPSTRADVPLLYGPSSDEPDAVPLVTPSEEEMERFLGQQMAAGAQGAAAASARTLLPEPEALTAVPISAQRAAQLAAQSRRLEPDPWFDDDGTPTLIQPRQPDSAGNPGTGDTARPSARAASGEPGAGKSAATNAPNNAPNNGITNAPALPPTVAPTIAPTVRQIGRFTGLKRQGRTEAGTLYRATDPKSGRDVAIHVLQGPACDSERLRPLLVQQLQLAAGLSHPNIAAVDEVGSDDGQPYLVSGVVDGETLPQRLQTQGPLSIQDTLLFGLQLARALDHAHRHGIWHRDLKPSNVLILGDGKTLQLTGFGIAAPAEAPGEVTVLGPAAGVRQYMTPEQTRGEPQDARSDVFAAGVILYEMLAGERPFRGATLLALATRIATEEPSPLQRVRPDVPPALRRVVDRCLSKAPAQRYASAKDLAEALLRVVTEIEAAQLGQGSRAGWPLRTRWAALSAGLAAVLVGAAAAAAALWQLGAIDAQADVQGRSLARFAAAQHAEQVLAEDWDAVAAQLLPGSQSWGGAQVLVVDAAGLVRVASDAAMLGQAYRGEGSTWSAAGTPGADGTLARQVGGRLDFDAPIQLQGKTLGRIVIGLPAAALLQSGHATGWLLALLTLTAAAVAGAVSYLLASRLGGALAQAGAALAEIGKGRFDHRIADDRRDELGQLFAAVDATAQALQRREAGLDPSPPSR